MFEIPPTMYLGFSVSHSKSMIRANLIKASPKFWYIKEKNYVIHPNQIDNDVILFQSLAINALECLTQTTQEPVWVNSASNFWNPKKVQNLLRNDLNSVYENVAKQFVNMTYTGIGICDKITKTLLFHFTFSWSFYFLTLLSQRSRNRRTSGRPRFNEFKM